MVKVHYDEGLTNHIGPESCVAVREGVREALTGYVQAKRQSVETLSSGMSMRYLPQKAKRPWPELVRTGLTSGWCWRLISRRLKMKSAQRLCPA